MAICSLYLTWERHELSRSDVAAIPSAMYTDVSQLHSQVSISGFHTQAHWPVTIFAIGCGVALLFKPDSGAKSAVAVTHFTFGLLTFILSVRWLTQSGFQAIAGPILCGIAGTMLLIGAVERYSVIPRSGIQHQEQS